MNFGGFCNSFFNERCFKHWFCVRTFHFLLIRRQDIFWFFWLFWAFWFSNVWGGFRLLVVHFLEFNVIGLLWFQFLNVIFYQDFEWVVIPVVCPIQKELTNGGQDKSYRKTIGQCLDQVEGICFLWKRADSSFQKPLSSSNGDCYRKERIKIFCLSKLNRFFLWKKYK